MMMMMMTMMIIMMIIIMMIMIIIMMIMIIIMMIMIIIMMIMMMIMMMIKVSDSDKNDDDPYSLPAFIRSSPAKNRSSNIIGIVVGSPSIETHSTFSGVTIW